jgi:hypothetical protein
LEANSEGSGFELCAPELQRQGSGFEAGTDPFLREGSRFDRATDLLAANGQASASAGPARAAQPPKETIAACTSQGAAANAGGETIDWN